MTNYGIMGVTCPQCYFVCLWKQVFNDLHWSIDVLILNEIICLYYFNLFFVSTTLVKLLTDIKFPRSPTLIIFSISVQSAIYLVSILLSFMLTPCLRLPNTLLDSSITRLQRVQNILARSVCLTVRHHHITPTLRPPPLSSHLATLSSKFLALSQSSYDDDISQSRITTCIHNALLW